MIWSLIVKFLSGNIIGKLFDAWAKSKGVDLAKYQTAAGVGGQVVGSVLNAEVENNRLKVAQAGWWGSRAIILMAGLPMAAHMAAVALDTVIPPFGSWGIPKLPPPYDSYERDIVLSFFLVMPAMSIVGGFVAWLQRR